ncbi:MAG TPA: hypothetical protein VFR09_08395 [Alphaproteobacteria bacterium]|nr:hypothetical protein [Alphaproteobacteria bacterium]
MKMLLWYVGVLVLVHLAFLGLILLNLKLGRMSQADAGGAATMMAFGFGGGVVAIPGFAAAMVLWRKFIQHDATISKTLWIVCAVVLVLIVQGVVQNWKDIIKPFAQVYWMTIAGVPSDNNK